MSLMRPYAFLSTLSLRRATHNRVALIPHQQFLSTLSLRRATGKVKVVEPGFVFLSTLSLRRATELQCVLGRKSIHFYPRSPCGERLELLAKWFCNSLISIHALLAESDRVSETLVPRQYQFLSTLSLRRATSDRVPLAESTAISIHALLAESDCIIDIINNIINNFYPRSPCGERHDTSSLMQCQAKFLSTLSLRRATRYVDR